MINDLKGLFFPPNMMLPLLEKETLPKSSHRLSSGMCVLMGAKELFLSVVSVPREVVVGDSLDSPVSPAGCGGRLGALGDLGLDGSRTVSGGAPWDAALSVPSIFFRNRFDPPGPIPKFLLSFLVREVCRVGDNGDAASDVGDATTTLLTFAARCGTEMLGSGGGDGGQSASNRCSSSEYTEDASAMSSNSFW